jgi:hypothetical protein
MEWRCPSGHVVPGAAEFDMWCPECGDKVIAIKEVSVTDNSEMVAAMQSGATIPVPFSETMQKPKLAAALAAFQAEMPRVAKSRKVAIQPREGRAYSYEYAELGAVNDAAMPLLGKHGLSFSAKPTWVYRPESTPVFCLIYKLMHSSGEQEVGVWPLPSPGNAGMQALGSAITYARRYAFQAVTGVAPAPGEDDDGAAAEDAPRPDVQAVPSDRKADDVQKRRINNRLTEMGIADNEETRMGWVSGVLGAYYEHLADLTREDALAAIERLKPANRQGRNVVIEALKGIGLTAQEDVIAKLAEWTGREIGSTGDLCMAEVEMVHRKATGIRAEMDAQNHAAEGERAEEASDDKPADA